MIVQDDGQPIGYDVREVEQYDTPEGEHVTVEEDYQVVYGEGESQEVQYTHIERYQTRGATAEITSSSTRPIGYESDGIRYSSSSSNRDDYRNSYEVNNYETVGTAGIAGIAGTTGYEYQYKPAASLSSTLAGSYNQYATSPSSGAGITSSGTGYTSGLATDTYTSSSLGYQSSLPSYTNYQPNYNPPTVSVAAPSSGYEYTSSYINTDSLGSSAYDYTSSATSNAYGTAGIASSGYDYTKGTTGFSSSNNYTTGTNYTGAFSSTSPITTYDYLSQNRNDGGYAGSGASLTYSSSLAAGSGIPSYDYLRSNLASGIVGVP